MLERSFDAEFLLPMAVSLAFGVIFATFITLILVPTEYLILDDIGKGMRRLFGRDSEDRNSEDVVPPIWPDAGVRRIASRGYRGTGGAVVTERTGSVGLGDLLDHLLRERQADATG